MNGITVDIIRECGYFPGDEDEIHIRINGGMNGGTLIVVRVPFGHDADDVRITHTEGNGEETVAGGRSHGFDFPLPSTCEGINPEAVPDMLSALKEIWSTPSKISDAEFRRHASALSAAAIAKAAR